MGNFIMSETQRHGRGQMKLEREVVPGRAMGGPRGLKLEIGTFLPVQWLRLQACLPIQGATGSVPGQGNKIPHAV